MNKKRYFVIDLSLFILRIDIVCYHGNRTNVIIYEKKVNSDVRIISQQTRVEL